MFCRCVALSLTAALLCVANANADPFVFDPDGPGGLAPIPNAAGFDPAPGNLLAVGGNTAIQAFISSGGTVQTPFVSYVQATIPTVLVGGGGAAVGVSGADLTVVAAITERVTGATGLGAGGIATFEIVPGGAANYLEIYQGGAPANNLTGIGFNDGNLVLRAVLTQLQTIQAFTVGSQGTQQNLDQFLGDNYPNIDTLTGSGGFNVLGTVTFVNPAYISGVTAGNIINFNLSTSTVAPFAQVDPSAAFLVGTTLTAQGAAPVPAGAGTGGTPGVSIGAVNLAGTAAQGGGPDSQFQADAAISFQEVPGSVTNVPEPASMAVFGLMAVGAGIYGSVRQRHAKAQTV